MSMIAGGHGEANPNKTYLSAKGIWITYTLVVVSVHVILLAVPMVSISFAWTITNILHNLVSCIPPKTNKLVIIR